MARSVGGAGKVELPPDDATDVGAVKSLLFPFPADDESEVAVAVPSPKPLEVIRLYLLASEKPGELDGIERRCKASNGP